MQPELLELQRRHNELLNAQMEVIQYGLVTGIGWFRVYRIPWWRLDLRRARGATLMVPKRRRRGIQGQLRV